MLDEIIFLIDFNNLAASDSSSFRKRRENCCFRVESYNSFKYW